MKNEQLQRLARALHPENSWMLQREGDEREVEEGRSNLASVQQQCRCYQQGETQDGMCVKLYWEVRMESEKTYSANSEVKVKVLQECESKKLLKMIS